MAMGVAAATLLLSALIADGELPDASGFRLAFVVMGLLGLASIPAFWVLPATAGRHLSRAGARRPALDKARNARLEGEA